MKASPFGKWKGRKGTGKLSRRKKRTK